MASELLHVFLNSTKAGRLLRDGAQLSFEYDAEYLATHFPLPLSRHLPLKPEAFTDNDSRAFFANLLPEGAIRTQIARQVGVSAENVYGLLEAIGGDCAGAISVRTPENANEKSGTYRWIQQDVLCSELNNLPAHPFLAGEEGVRLSLAGAQNKLPIYFDGKEFFIPEGNFPSSHILKTAILQLDNSVVNEAFCMNLAARVGLPVPKSTTVLIGDQLVFMIERYDRLIEKNGTVTRLHQEDFCQALGIPPEMKYEKEGGPGFKECFRLVEEWSDEPLLDIQNLLNWSLFNFIVGNADAHGKNLSFLYAEGNVRLAPFYDIISTAVYERVNNKFAMKMGGQKDPRYLLESDLKHFATDIDVDIRTVKSSLTNLLKRIEVESVKLSHEYNELLKKPVILAAIRNIINQRSGKAKALVALSH
jgi:serine/threonine-protein kinase HipA